MRKLIHIDMDAFFASVEQRDCKSLIGKPVIVGGCSKRGVVCAASYKARKFGIHSAMAMRVARKLCPNGIFIEPRIDRYVEVSKQIMQIFHDYTESVEPLSLDEAYMDVTENKLNIKYASKIARKIKIRIKNETGLTASAGVGSNKFIAKIASDHKKPDGFVVVTPDKIKEFIEPLPVSKIPGVGQVTEERLKTMGIKTIAQLSKLPLGELNKFFGKTGTLFYNLSRGIDDRPVNSERKIKSVGDEMTFDTDIIDIRVIKEKLLSIIAKLYNRLERSDIKGRTITLKVKYHNFSLISRSQTLWFYTRDKSIIYKVAMGLFKKTEIGTTPVRLIGISISQLWDHPLYEQLLLFDPEETFNNL